MRLGVADGVLCLQCDLMLPLKIAQFLELLIKKNPQQF